MDKEKWLLYNNVEWERLWGQWNETLTTTRKLVSSKEGDDMFMVALEEVLYYEFLSENQTINSHKHCFQLVQLKTAPQWKPAGISQQKMHNLPLLLFWLLNHARLFETPGTEAARLLCPWDFPRKNTVVGCHFLLQWDLPNPRIQLPPPVSAGGLFTTKPPGKANHPLG